MERRPFLAAVALATFAPLRALPQTGRRIARIGVLSLYAGGAQREALMAALIEALREHGWVEGQNLVIERREVQSVDRLADAATELVRANVDVIFAASSTHVEQARKATTTIPIVFAVHGDPVGTGHVASLTRPGGNITGLAQLLTELSAKELQLLKSALPQVSRMAIVWNPTTPSHGPAMKAVENAAAALGVTLYMVPVRTGAELEDAFASMVRERVQAFLVIASPMSLAERDHLGQLALKNRLPGIFGFKENVQAGGLMSYGPELSELYRRAAVYIDKILKGAKPGELPVEQAAKYELVINARTAKALGITIPNNLLLRADLVID